MKLRFAPSPTGYMHVGNCRTLLINWLFARHYGGEFLLRLDDTDRERSEKKYEDALLEDMGWLGLNFDDYQRQSDRFDRYRTVAETLKASGRLYPCYETPEELEFKRKRQMARGLPPIYDRAALQLTAEEKLKFEAENRKPHWRFLLNDAPIDWNDLIRGPIHIEGSNLSDPVLIREDGFPIYTFASVVDDMDMNITHIIRGEDHLTNTAVQIQIWRALGVADGVIKFGHLSLLSNADGTEFSKRLGSMSLRDLRQQGILPMALNSLLAKLGTSDPVHVYENLDALVAEFDITKFAKGTPKFSLNELTQLNTKIIHTLSYEKAIESTHFSSMDPLFWKAVQPNLEQLSDLEMWWTICRGEVATFAENDDKIFIEEALASLPAEPWNPFPWDQWITHLKTATHRKGKDLFMPLRRALTGQDHGPELRTIVQLMGYNLARKRLQNSLN